MVLSHLSAMANALAATDIVAIQSPDPRPQEAIASLLLHAQQSVTTSGLQHIAVIMDGNRRWAKGQGLPALAGHQQGVASLKRFVRFASDAGVRTVTAYAFSTENWSRSEQEVGFLMGLFVTALTEELEELHAHQVRLSFIGQLSAMPFEVQQTFQRACDRTADNQGLHLRLAVNYGARQELVEAMQSLARQVQQGRLQPEDLTEAHISQALYEPDIQAPDLLIRPGGEHRLSNFLLWQCAYTELVWSSVFWPEFDEACLTDALAVYAARQRRFGK